MGRMQTGWFRAATGFARAAVLGLALSCNSSPTEPSDPSIIAVDVGGGPSGSGGQILVRADTCACASASLQLVLDGVSQATIGCGGERTLVVAAGQHTLKVFSSAFTGALTATVTVSTTQGVVVRLSCR